MFIELLNRFKDSKNASSVISVYLFLQEYKEPATYTLLHSELKLPKKNIVDALEYLVKSELISKINEEYIYSNQVVIIESDEDIALALSDKKQISKKEENIILCNQILENLSKYSGRNFVRNSTYERLISRHIKSGYSFSDFEKVNLYYSEEWNNPTMSKYITPKTLYNTDFPARVDDASNFFTENNMEIYKKSQYVINQFHFFNNKFGLSDQQYFLKDVKRIMFWLEKYDFELVCGLVENIYNEWHSDVQMSKYIIPSVVFSDKFPDRINQYQHTTQNSLVNESNSNLQKTINFILKIQKIAISYSFGREKLIETINQPIVLKILDYFAPNSSDLKLFTSMNGVEIKEKTISFMKAEGVF